MSAPARTTRIAILAAALAVAFPRAALASKADAFENKIDPVSGQLFEKALRVELTPSVNLSLNDAFYSKVLGGAKLTFHFSESLAVSASYAGTLNDWPGSGSQLCQANAGCTGATSAQLFQLPGLIKAIAGGEVAFSPVYGKLNVLAEKVVHFDLSVLGGVDWISSQSALSKDAVAKLTVDPAAKPPGQSTFGGHLGVGARVFLARFLALRLELKDYLYAVPIGTDEKGGGGTRQLQNQLMSELGVSVFFPFSNRGER